MGQKRFNTTAILNSHKEKTESMRITDVANKFVEVNDNRKRNFGTFTVEDLSAACTSKVNLKASSWVVLSLQFLFLVPFSYIFQKKTAK